MHLNFETFFFRYILGACVLTLVFAAGVYAYLGTFSRYRADDYCEAVRVRRSSPVAAVIERYFSEDWPRATMRYSNLLFVGMSESLGPHHMQITIVSMVLLWFAGCIWGVYELRRLLGILWAIQVDLFLGLAFGFLSLFQAPNLYQSVYWRSAMMTHFAPLVFGLFLIAFLLRQARSAGASSPLVLVCLFVGLVTFVIAGFSEPPTTTLLTLLPLLLLAVWLWDRPPGRRRRLILLVSVVAGALLGLLTMLVSPASAGAAQEETLQISQLLKNSFLYSYLFIVDSLKTRPLPIFLSLLIPLLFMWLYRQTRTSDLSPRPKRTAMLVMVVIPFLTWLLIAAGFSPSVYGQSFPVERMRFLARAMMIASLMLEGALLGLLAEQINFPKNPSLGKWAVAVVFGLIAVGYPGRTAINILQFDLPEYRAGAEKWDRRDAYIRESVAAGARDLVVIQLDTVGGVQEYKDRATFWVNRCAAEYYGLNSLRAP